MPGLSLSLGVGLGGGSAASAQPAPTGPMLLYRIGQSNAVTASQSSATGTARYGSTLTDMFIWVHASSAWQAYTLGTNTGHQGTADSGAYSVEAEIVHQMRLAGDTRPVYVIKEAVSGNGIDPVDTNGNWWPGGAYSGGGTYSAGTRWTGLLAQRTAALAHGSAPVSPTEYVLINQGEADIKAVASAARQANMTAFIAKLRSDVSATGKIIIERCRPGIDGSTYGGADRFAWSYALREGDMAAALADGNATLVDADFTFPANTAVHPAVNDQTWVHSLGQRSHAVIKGTYSGTYGAITDAAPSAFTFTDTSAEVSTVASSNVIAVAGIERRAAISVTGGEYKITNTDGTTAVDWTSSGGYINKFQSVQVRGTAPGTAGQVQNVVLTIGGVSDTFAITATAAVSYEAETTAFLATVAANGGGSWSSSKKGALNNLYISLKANGLLSGKLRCFFIGASVDSVSGLVDLVDQTTLATQSTAPGSTAVPWTAAGWNPGNVNTRGLNLQCNPSTETSQNDIGLFVWMNSLSSDAQFDITSADGTVGMYVQSSAMRAKLHTTTNQNLTGLTNTTGFYAVNRTGATTTTFYGPAGTALAAANSVASATPTATQCWLGSPAGSGTNADRDVGAHGLFTGMTGADIANLRGALVTFFTEFAT